MSDVPPSVDTAAAMVQAVTPDVRVDQVDPVDGGTHDLWFVTVSTDAGMRELVLKAKGDGPEAAAPSRGIRVESRLLELLGATTDLPVPAVLGRVDDHERLPAPFFLMTRLDGTPVATEPWELAGDRLDHLARATGEHLRTLHGVHAFDAFGGIRPVEDADPAGGARPLAAEYDLTVEYPVTSWRDRMDVVVEEELERFTERQFADLEPRVRPALEAGLAALDQPERPVLAQFDYNLENVLVDPDTDAVRGLLDWELGVTATHPEWHLAWTEANFCGTDPLGSARRERARKALYEGYNAATAFDRDEGFERRRRFYLLLRATIAMNQLEHFPGDEAGYRALVEELL